MQSQLSINKIPISLACGIIWVHFFLPSAVKAQAYTQSQIQQLSCAPTGGAALSKGSIENRGTQLGFALDSNTMGRAFQNFALDSVNVPENFLAFPSRVREIVTALSKTTHKYVVPDAVGSITTLVIDSKTGAVVRRGFYDLSVIEEVKFTTSTINLSSFEHQIIGHIDVAKNSPAGRAPTSL